MKCDKTLKIYKNIPLEKVETMLEDYLVSENAKKLGEPSGTIYRFVDDKCYYVYSAKTMIIIRKANDHE